MSLPTEGLPTFDIESIHWKVPIAVGFFDGYNYHEFIKSSEDDDVIWRFLQYLRENFKGIKLYAHYASRFDNQFILASLRQHNEIVAIEAGFLRLRWKEPNITFEDSFPMVPMSLERMNKMFGVEEKERWEHEKGLSPWEMGDKLSTFREYLRNDCISLSHSLYKLCEMLGTTFGQLPSISLATTAAKIFDKCFYPLGKVEPNEEYEEFIRKAIFGGRNEVYKRYGESINLYDIHWMFTSCYDVPVPIGKLRWVKPNIDTGTLAEAKVKVPKDWYIGPLPHKVGGLLCFPVGEFEDWWDLRELRNAANMGVDVTIKRQLSCEEEPILLPFRTFMEQLDGKGPKNHYWKMFGLSLSGKLGQGRWRDVVKHSSEIENFEGWSPLDDKEEYFVSKEYLNKKAPYIRPLIAMRVRSEARIRHLKVILEASKKGTVFYGDTDSIYTDASMPTGTNMGELVHIGKADRGYFIRQKLYALVQGGRLKQVSAGYSDLKLKEEDFINLLNGGQLEIQSSFLSSYKRTLSTKEVELLTYSKRIHGGLGNTRIEVGRDTEPICLPLKEKSTFLLEGS